jgi:hypothetical protein
MAGQPALAGPQQLVDLVRSDPVVLGVVQHRKQHVQVVEGVGQAYGPGQGEIHVCAVAGQRVVGRHVVERDRGGRDAPAERLEQARGQVRAAAQHRHPDLQRHRPGRQLGAVLGGAAQRGPEHL